MAKIEERLRHVELKVRRANEHIVSLKQQLRTFFESGPYQVATKQDPATRKLIYYVANVEPVPDCVPLIAGDAIQNLVSALDHLAYQIVCSDTADNPPNSRGIYFPIGDDVAKYEGKKRKRLEGVTQETMSTIDALQPYKGGNDLFWTLQQLNNIEKHRILFTVGSQAAGVHLGQIMASQVGDVFPAEAIKALESMTHFLNPAHKGFPLTAGHQLYIGGVDEKPNPKQQFRFEVVLNEPGVVKGESVVKIVDEFARLVEDVVATLSSRLK